MVRRKRSTARISLHTEQHPACTLFTSLSRCFAGSIGVTILMVGLTVQNLYILTQLPGMPTNMQTFGHPFAAFSGDVKCAQSAAVLQDPAACGLALESTCCAVTSHCAPAYQAIARHWSRLLL